MTLLEEAMTGNEEELSDFYDAEYLSSNEEEEEEEDDEQDDEEEEGNPLDNESPKKSNKLTFILIGAGLFLITIFMVVGYFYLYGNDSSKIDTGSEIKTPSLKAPALYVDFPQEEILAILEDEVGKTHHVVVRVVLLTRDPHVKQALAENSALIISEFLELLESQDYAYLLTYDGKVAIRKTFLKHLKKSIPDYGSNVEEVLLTKFIMD